MPKASTKETAKKAAKKSKTPYYHKPDELSFEEWQIALRREFGQEQQFIMQNTGDHPVFSDFEITNPFSNSTYKVAIRSEEPGPNYCACPDFSTNTLGTCKHIEFALHKLKRKRGAKKLFKAGFAPPYSSVSLQYGQQRKVVLRIGETESKQILDLAQEYFDKSNVLKPEAYDVFEEFVEKVLVLDPEFRCYQDALDFILEIRDTHKRQQIIDKT